MKNLVWIIFLGLSLPDTLWGQFGPAQIILQGPGEKGEVELADFDGDGDPDVLSGSDQFWQWYENKDGEGLLSFPHPIKRLEILNDYQQQFPVHAGDLDGDGDPDVVGISQPDGFKIVWLPNDGNGRFGPERILTPDTLSHSDRLWVSDTDGDGDLDLLTVNNLANTATQNQIILYENDGAGNFSISAPLDQENIFDFFQEDLVGDHLPDLVTIYFANGDRFLAISEQLPNGTFAAPQNIPLGGLEPFAIQAERVDNDTLMDIVVAFGNFTLGWVKNEGQSNFSFQSAIGENIDIFSNFTAADLDADGDGDVVVSTNPDSLIWLENTPGQWLVHNLLKLRPSSASSKLKGLGVGDLDQDGQPDILFNQASSGRGNLQWLRQSGNGNFAEPLSFPQADHPGVLHGADLDQDGDPDFVVAETFSHRLFWVENQGDGRFENQSQIDVLPDAPGDVVCADLDADGLVDVVVSARLSGVRWYRNLGNGVFDTLRHVNTELIDPRGIFPVDLNGDESLDLLIAGGLEHRVVWNANDGAGNFSPQISIADNFRDVRFVTAGDLDDDADADALAVSVDFNSYRVAWFENDGTGAFSGEQLITDPAENFLYECQVIDLDADGHNDILMAYVNLFTDSLVWIKNNGAGTFTEPVLIGSDARTSLHVADFDLDGYPDAVVLNSFFSDETGIHFFRNNGAGRLVADTALIDDLLPAGEDLYPADLDADGDPDLLSLFSDWNQIAWYPNLEIQPRISCIPFWDSDGNGVRDSLEVLLGSVRFDVAPLPLAGFSTPDGRFEVAVRPGTYEVAVQLDSCFILTTGSPVTTVETAGDDLIELFFGLQSDEDTRAADIHLVSGPTRCDQIVPFWLNLSNTGCRPDTGRFSLVIPSSTSEIAALTEVVPPPDEIAEDTLWWDFETFPYEHEQVVLFFQLPGADNLGDTLRFSGGAYQTTAAAALVLVDSFFYKSAITCAFDPNDKLVEPDRRGVYESNLTLFEEPLRYTIRFQNTGNDTAFTVVIRDTLRSDLDWRTFQPGPSSHSYQTTLDANGVVVFTFENILLPDSTTNEPASQGFVSFSISAKAGLPENTIILNRAGIYFDLNPPILTNTVTTELVSQLPVVSQQIKYPHKHLTINALPNPFSTEVTFQVKGITRAENYDIRLYSSTGQAIGQMRLSPPGEALYSDPGGSGLVIFQLVERSSGKIVGAGKLVRIRE